MATATVAAAAATATATATAAAATATATAAATATATAAAAAATATATNKEKDMLQNQAMIANLNIRSWTARKHDRAVSNEVDAAHNAQEGGRYNKLLIDKSALDPLTKHAGRVREYHYSLTLPWGDNGDRLLPAKAYMDYTATMRKLKDEYASYARTFEASYPQLVADARQRLGTMYDANDYPPISDIRDRFDIRVAFQPVPDAKDFRVDVGDEALAEIKASINEAVAERQAGAVKECWVRLNDVIGKLYTMMIKDKPIFRDSIIDNVKDLISMLPKLNITNDPALNEVCKKVSLVVNSTSPHYLRKSARMRNDVALAAEGVLREIADHT